MNTWCLARRHTMVSAAEAERILGIPAARVRQWAKRGHIHAAGLDQSGRPLYDLDTLKRRAEAHAA